MTGRRPAGQFPRGGRFGAFCHGGRFLAGCFAFGATRSGQSHAVHLDWRRAGNNSFPERVGDCLALSEAIDRLDSRSVGARDTHAARSGESRAAGHAHHANQFLAEFSDDLFHGRIGALSVSIRRVMFSRIKFQFFPKFSVFSFFSVPSVLNAFPEKR